MGFRINCFCPSCTAVRADADREHFETVCNVLDAHNIDEAIGSDEYESLASVLTDAMMVANGLVVDPEPHEGEDGEDGAAQLADEVDTEARRLGIIASNIIKFEPRKRASS